MSKLYFMDKHLDVNAKWEIVKRWYEPAYSTKDKPIRLLKKPSDDQVDYLYQNMEQMKLSADQHFSKKPGLKEKFQAISGISPQS